MRAFEAPAKSHLHILYIRSSSSIPPNVSLFSFQMVYNVDVWDRKHETRTSASNTSPSPRFDSKHFYYTKTFVEHCQDLACHFP